MIENHKKVSLDPHWREKYKDIIATPDQAVRQIKPGNRVFIGTGCAQPLKLVQALADRSANLADIEVVHLLTFGEAPYAKKQYADIFRVNSLFIAANVRDVIQQGYGDYTPIFLSDIPRLFSSGQLPLDVALIQVGPPDTRGMCSLGVSVDIVKCGAENASLVIAEVNPQMPRTLGDSFVHLSDMDILVEVNEPLPEVKPQVPTEVTRQIGEYVASLVEDGSTLELGIGRIPQAVLEFLKNKRDLGIHTEMFTDSIIDVIEAGAITGAYKTIDRGKIVASFCLGTRKLYDYIDNNPLFSFRPTEYVNNPFIISKLPKMVAINVALEVDLTGQVCADSLGTNFFSGIGGQVDFNRGASRSAQGKAIIALPSTARNGEISRIQTRLSSGAGVVTTRGDVHYVVTEYGIAYLHGKSIQERALALISIAHPRFREKLMKEAIEAKFVSEEHKDVEGKIYVGPPEFSTHLLLNDGTLIKFRPIHPTDESRMKDLFYDLTQQTIYYRFMKQMNRIPRKQIREFIYVDHRNEVAIVGTLPEAYGEDIIAIGRYYLDRKTNQAEVAFTVKDQWQNRGIGTYLMNLLITIAKRNGISGFTAEVLQENKAMQRVFHKSECQVKSRLNEGVYSFELAFY
ncbi:MAG: 4-hydroxybutyrate CoA-transferase [Phycisphaerae bacterium SM23_30]|nr:MAG: 4-hydroxybutyrate CoA-transferase [Phycisphaerae bacterium SM23_30]